MRIQAITAVNSLIFEECCPVGCHIMRERFTDVSLELNASIFRDRK
jgi:hypothetical protein